MSAVIKLDVNVFGLFTIFAKAQYLRPLYDFAHCFHDCFCNFLEGYCELSLTLRVCCFRFFDICA